MPAAVTDKFIKTGAATKTSLASPGKAVGASSININSATNWPTDTAVVFAIRTIALVDGEYQEVAGTYTEWVGTVSGTTINSLALAYGTDQVYAAGSTTEVFIPVSSYAHNRLIDGLLSQHNQDGTHKSITTDTINATSSISDNGTTLQTIRSASLRNFIASGCSWSATSGLNATMTSGVVYISGKHIAVSAISSRSFSASKDTYVSVDINGTLSYSEVANSATAPSLPANSLSLAKIVTGASSVSSVTDLRHLGINPVYTATATGGISASDGGTTLHDTSQAAATFTLHESSRVIVESSVRVEQSLASGGVIVDTTAQINISGTGYGNIAKMGTNAAGMGGMLNCLADTILPAGTYRATTYVATGNGSYGFKTEPNRGYIKVSVRRA